MASRYAPDIYKSLNGILLAYKPADLTTRDLVNTLKERICQQLSAYDQRPISTKLEIIGAYDEEKHLTEIPNLADHPLVVGPRFLPWELRVGAPIHLGYRASGAQILLFGRYNKYLARRLRNSSLINVYELSGQFGFITDTHFHDGKIQDRTTFKHIKSSKIDSALAKIEATQQHRLFDAANVKLDSDEAYELAKAWPSKPPTMADWPVIYRLRCTHLNLPDFKIEVTCVNETLDFLASLVNGIGLMLKSGAYTKSVKRIKLGPWDIKDALVVERMDIQSLVNHFQIHDAHFEEIGEMLRQSRAAGAVRTEYRPEYSRNPGNTRQEALS